MCIYFTHTYVTKYAKFAYLSIFIEYTLNEMYAQIYFKKFKFWKIFIKN